MSLILSILNTLYYRAHVLYNSVVCNSREWCRVKYERLDDKLWAYVRGWFRSPLAPVVVAPALQLAAFHPSVIGERKWGVRCFSPCPRPSSSSYGSPSISEHQRRVLWGEWPLPVAAPAGSCPFSPQFRAYPANSGSGGIISLRQWTGAAGEAWASRARAPRPRQRAGHQPRARTRTKAGSLNGLTTSKVTSADGSCSATVCCPITGKQRAFYMHMCWCHSFKMQYMHIFRLYWAVSMRLCGRSVQGSVMSKQVIRAVKHTCGRSMHFMSASLVWTDASPLLKTLAPLHHRVFPFKRVLKCHYEWIKACLSHEMTTVSYVTLFLLVRQLALMLTSTDILV